MTWFKRIAIALAVLVLLVAAGLAVFVATFDANRYKSLAVDWMKTNRQRTLTIDGPIGVSVFPRVAVTVSKVKLSERNRNDEFASVGEASLALELLPLLRKQVVVDRISARGVRATYVRDAKGVSNIDDLIARDEKAAPTPDSGPAPQFDIAGVKLDDVVLNLRDEMSKTAGTVTLRSFQSGRLADGVATPLRLDAAVELSRPQALKLDLGGATTLKLDLQRKGFALADAKLDVRGDTQAAKGLAVTLQGALGWDGKGLSAGPLTVAVNSARLGDLALSPSRLEAKRVLYQPDTRQIELDALQLALAGKQGGSGFELALDWPQLSITGEQLKGSALSGRFKTTGSNALAGKLASKAPSGSFEALRLPGVTLTVEGSSGPRKVNASLATDVLLRAPAASAAFERLDLRATLADPNIQPLNLALSGSATVGAKNAQWSVAGSLNADKFESNGTAVLGGAVPKLQAAARFDQLDINKVMRPTSTAPAPTAAAPAETAVDLSGLRAVDGRFSLAAGKLVFRQYTVNDAKLDAALDGGVLRIARLNGRAWNGTLDGSGSADAKGNRIGIQFAANGVNVNTMLKDVAGKDLLDGTGRVTANVTTSGASLGALRSGLDGTVALNVRDGAIKGVNLARAMRQAKAALSMKQDALSKAQSSEKTDFSEMTASARITNGVARSDDLDIKSPFLRIGGAGTLDIGRGRIDYTARATVVGAPAGQDGAELAALKGVTVPVLLSGPFEAIDWKIQWSGVAAAAVEAKVKDKLTEKLGAKLGLSGAASAPQGQNAQPADKLKDKLRGLFGK